MHILTPKRGALSTCLKNFTENSRIKNNFPSFLLFDNFLEGRSEKIVTKEQLESSK